jgi:hypothetical protein
VHGVDSKLFSRLNEKGPLIELLPEKWHMKGTFVGYTIDENFLNIIFNDLKSY